MSYITNRKNKSPEVYPDRRGGGTGQGPFARNFASGPDNVTSISAGGDGGTQVPWNVIDSGALGGPDVPITPLSTGIVLIQGVLTIKNSADAFVNLQLQVQVDGVSLDIPFNENITIVGDISDTFAVVPFCAEATGTVGTTFNVQILLLAGTGDALSIVAESSTISLQEVSAATG